MACHPLKPIRVMVPWRLHVALDYISYGILSVFFLDKFTKCGLVNILKFMIKIKV